MVKTSAASIATLGAIALLATSTDAALKITPTQKKNDHVLKFKDDKGNKEKVDFGKTVKIPKGENGAMKKSKTKDNCGASKTKFKFKNNNFVDESIVPISTFGEIPGVDINDNSYYTISHYNTWNTDATNAPGPAYADPLTVDLLTDYDVFEKANYVDISSELNSDVTFQSQKQYEMDSGIKRMESELLYDGLMAPITLLYDDDNEVVWGSSFTHIFKVYRGNDRLKKVATIERPHWQKETLQDKDLFHGAYAIYVNQIYYSPARSAVYAFTDACPGDNESGIMLFKTYNIPLEKGDGVRGLSMASDGNLIYVTKFAKVGIINPNTGAIQDYTPTNSDSACNGGEISNNFAIVQDGEDEFIVYVTDKCMNSLTYDSTSQPSLAWQTLYNDGNSVPVEGRLGTGSGTTPSIIEPDGCGSKYIVIADGQKLMNYILFDIADGAIVAQGDVTFGQTDGESTTEQSILVTNNQFTVTSNSYKKYHTKNINGEIKTLMPIFYGDNPRGLETFEVTCSEGVDVNEKWVNKEVSIPNGITTASLNPGNERIYGIGRREFYWKDIENYRLKTKNRLEQFFYNKLANPKHLSHVGKLASYTKWSQSHNKGAEVAGVYNEKVQDFFIINDLIHEPINEAIASDVKHGTNSFTPITDESNVHDKDKITLWTLEGVNMTDGFTNDYIQILGSGLKYNSAYAATEIGPDEEIITGTALGIMRIKYEDTANKDFGAHKSHAKYVRDNDTGDFVLLFD